MTTNNEQSSPLLINIETLRVTSALFYLTLVQHCAYAFSLLKMISWTKHEFGKA